nr:unnamed protein product [Spirometra erinaceieuropaei]
MTFISNLSIRLNGHISQRQQMKAEEESHEISQDYEKIISELKQKTTPIEIPPGPQCYCGNPRDFREPDFLCSPRKANDSWHANIHKTLTSNELFHAVDVKSDLFVSLSCQDLSKIGPSYERFRALTSQLKTNFSKLGLPSPGIMPDSSGFTSADGSGLSCGPNASPNIGGDGYGSVTRKRKGDNSLAMGDVMRGDAGFSAFSQCGAGGSHGASSVTGNMGTNERGGGSIRSTRRSAAAHAHTQNGSSCGLPGFGGFAVDDSKAKVNAFGVPIDHPFNKEGYRYILVEPDPHAVGRQIWDESEHTAGKPIPGYFYRVCHCPKVVLSLNDRAHQLKLHESQLTVTGEKGYCMVRATHSVHTGTWYFEATITDQPEGSATRIGWSQMLGNLQAPCGYDKFSYSWRSRLGTVFHQSRGKHYAETGYGKGDVIGCLISLPKHTGPIGNLVPARQPVSTSVSTGSGSRKGGGDTTAAKKSSTSSPEVPLLNYLPETYKDRPLIKFRNYYYFEEKDDPQAVEKKLRPLPGSKITFYRNGECMGVAFSDIFAGPYFPAISIYKSATVTVNFGPEFKHPPSPTESWQPMCERREEVDAEQALADMIYLTANDRLIDRLIKECAGGP